MHYRISCRHCQLPYPKLCYVFQACFVGDILELLFQQIPRLVLIEMLEKQYAKEHILWLVFFTIVNHTAQQVLTHTVKTTIHVGELKVPQYVVIRPWSLFPMYFRKRYSFSRTSNIDSEGSYR